MPHDTIVRQREVNPLQTVKVRERMENSVKRIVNPWLKGANYKFALALNNFGANPEELKQGITVCLN